jgi:hypothetical protein
MTDIAEGNLTTTPALRQTVVSRSFSFGECVKVLHCFHGHEFEIGEIVYIVGKSDYDDAWLCRNAKGAEWYLHDEEGEVVNCR